MRFLLPRFPPPLQKVGKVHEGVGYIEETNDLETTPYKCGMHNTSSMSGHQHM